MTTQPNNKPLIDLADRLLTELVACQWHKGSEVRQDLVNEAEALLLAYRSAPDYASDPEEILP